MRYGTPKENADIREIIAKKGLYNWQVARRIGVHPMTFQNWIREPLPEGDERRERILKALEDDKGERTNDE